LKGSLSLTEMLYCAITRFLSGLNV
jgi:hypothetical protein